MQARREDFYATLIAATEKYGVSPSRIELEITENIFVEPTNRVTTNLANLQKAGFTIALDDFGAGYSSLS